MYIYDGAAPVFPFMTRNDDTTTTTTTITAVPVLSS